MKKLLFYNDAKIVGGHEFLTIKALELLSKGDYSITFVMSRANDSLFEMLSEIESVKIVRIDVESTRLQIIKNFFDIKKNNLLSEIIRREKPDFIIAAQGNIEMSSGILFPSKKCSVPVITYIPLTYKLKDISNNKFIGAIKDLINKVYFNIPKYYITINEGMKEHLLERNINSENIFVVKNGVDYEKYSIRERSDACKVLNLDESKFIFGMIGRVEYFHKGQDLLLKVIDKYRDNYKDCCFLIAGDGGDLAQMKSEINHLGLNNQFIFLGNVSKTELVYSASDAVIIPSRYEGYEGTPLVLYEALYFSKKVAASKIRGIQELLPQKWLFEVGNIDEINDVLVNIKTSEVDLHILRSKVMNDFSLKNFQINFNKTIEKIVSK